jgi:hypothetical protein
LSFSALPVASSREKAAGLTCLLFNAVMTRPGFIVHELSELDGRAAEEVLKCARRAGSETAFWRDQPVHHSHRRFIAALGAGQIRSWGSLYYSFPLIAESMRTGLSKPDFYGAATIKLLLSGLAAYPLGSAIDRERGRRIMSFAMRIAVRGRQAA